MLVEARRVFSRLDEDGVPYCLLRGLDDLRVVQDAYEIDVLLLPHDLNRFGTLVAELGFQPMPAWGSAPHQFFIKHDSELGAWIKLDVVTDLRYGPHRAISAGRTDEYLKHRRLQTDGIYTLSPGDEFVHLLLHCVLDKGAIDHRHRTRLQELAAVLRGDADANASIASQFDEWLAPVLTWDAAMSACERSGWPWLVSLRHRLMRRLFQRQSGVAAWRAARSWTARRLRPLQRLGKGQGLIVALLGPDGAGKTSVANALVRSSPLAMRRVYMGYGRREEGMSRIRRGLWRLAHHTPVSDVSPGRRRLQLCLRWIARVALQAGRSTVVRWRRAAGDVILLDRHLYDFRVGDRREGQWRSIRHFLNWWLTGTSPTPDLVIVLDAPPALLWARKAEWPTEELERQRASYLRLATELSHAVVIDASADFPVVVKHVANEIWSSRSSAQRRAIPECTAVTPTPVEGSEIKEDVTKAQIRGSSLLLSGRIVALGLASLAQILLIRYLAPADFGRWVYALSVVTVLKSFAGLGIDRSITRFAALYHERGDHARLLGVMVLTIVTVLGVGGLMIGVLHAMPDLVSQLTHGPSESLRLLFILIFLVPLEAMDSVLLGVFACFGNARAIFFRRHVVAPGLRLVAVAVAVLSNASVAVVAYGYVAGAAAGILIYGRLLWRLCREHGLLGPVVRVIVPVGSPGTELEFAL